MRLIRPIGPNPHIHLPMTILEQALVPKNPKKKNEDGIVVTDHFIAVIDGSTSKSTRRYSLFHSNGEYAMRLVSKYIRKMPKTTTCHEFCTGVTKYIRKHYKSSQLPTLEAHPEDRLTASAVIFSRLNREIWMIGDCQALLTPRPLSDSHSSSSSVSSSSPAEKSIYLDNPKPYEQELADQRAAIIMASPLPHDHFLDDDTARQAIIPHMLETMQQQNKTYSVVDGFPIDKRHVRIVPLDLQPWEIVLASDGYPFLCPTLAESEARLEEQKHHDPLNIGTFRATKAFMRGNNSFDDRAYIRFTV